MKKLVLFAFALISSTGLFAQNPFTPASGNLPAATVGVAYSQTLDLTIPAQTTVDPATLGVPIPGIPPFTADVTDVTFTVTGLPSGLSATCSIGSCIYAGGATGTITIEGTPLPGSGGLSTITITSLTSGSGTVTVPIIGALPITFPGTVQGQAVPAAPQLFDGGPYAMQVNDPNAVQELSSSTFDVIQNIPNPFTGNTTIKFSAPTAGNVDFTVFDMIGKRVYSEKIQAQAKTNSINFNAEKLTSGTYFYSMSNGTKTITKKMIVAGK